ncbi:Flp family type IVb pilin [Caldovatus aquaticus]|uniref:Flp family type IVb pilin n=1 Tax=Caldovatus aquaticus TaxID=2865671 RepID=A0ABS7F0F3_9PROT|nr:Flp family type IVb pilin [Caldovatus aquaticus]MBW8269079.1 Flp family type IVb pilin [Caldovatus aquaticus]
MIELIRIALKDRKGVTAMEYAVIAAGLVVVVAFAADYLGQGIGNIFNQFSDWFRAKPGTLP